MALYRALLVLTYREEEVSPDHRLWTVLAGLPRGLVRRVSLPPLSRGAVEQLALRGGACSGVSRRQDGEVCPWTANSVTGVRVASMTAPPTATRGPASGRVAAAEKFRNRDPESRGDQPGRSAAQQTRHQLFGIRTESMM